MHNAYTMFRNCGDENPGQPWVSKWEETSFPGGRKRGSAKSSKHSSISNVRGEAQY